MSYGEILTGRTKTPRQQLSYPPAFRALSDLRLPTFGHLHGLLDGQGIGLSDRRLAVELPPDGTLVPVDETGEP